MWKSAGRVPPLRDLPQATSRQLPIDGSWMNIITGLSPVKGPYFSPLERFSLSFSIYQLFMEDEYPILN